MSVRIRTGMRACHPMPVPIIQSKNKNGINIHQSKINYPNLTGSQAKRLIISGKLDIHIVDTDWRNG